MRAMASDWESSAETSSAARRPRDTTRSEGHCCVIVNTRFYPHSLAGLAFARNRGIAPVLIEHGSAHLTLGNPLLARGLRYPGSGQKRLNALLGNQPPDVGDDEGPRRGGPG